MKPGKTLLLCSYGLRPGQVTLETLAMLRSCDAVFTNCLDRNAAAWFKPYCRELRVIKGTRWEPLAKKLFAAFAGRTKIAFLTYGNPFFLNPPARMLAEEASSRGISFEVAEGISSFDAIINLLRLGQYSANGLRLVNLGDGCAAKAREFTASMDTMLFSLWALEAGKPALKKKFLRELSAAYAPEHPVFVIDHPVSRKTTIGLLAGAPEKASLTTTLYIPAAGPKPSVVKLRRRALN